MAKRRKLSNPLALAILATLGERPMHPYEMASVLRSRGKEKSIKINYGSLYTVVQNLEKHGFIEVTGVQRQGRRPERTLYGLTEAGRGEMHDWLSELIQLPEQEYPRFEAALSMITALPPEEAIVLLGERVRRLNFKVAAARGVLKQALGQEGLPRIFLIETEYAAAMWEAEATWIKAFVEELQGGRISGVEAWRIWHATGGVPEEWAELEAAMGREHSDQDDDETRSGPERRHTDD